MKTCLVTKITEPATATIIKEANKSGGFVPHNQSKAEFPKLIEDSGFFLERKHAENDPEFKQIIPGFVIYDPVKKLVLLYQRRPAHTEQRLAGLWTPIFGGHVDAGDYETIEKNYFLTNKSTLVPNTIATALKREMAEETGLKVGNKYIKLAGYIYDDSNPVGRVHLGVIFVIFTDIDKHVFEMISSKSEINDVSSVRVDTLDDFLSDKDAAYDIEGWATIILENFDIVKNSNV